MYFFSKYSTDSLEITKFLFCIKSKTFNCPTKIFFTFDGADYEARFWKDMFHQICNIIAASHKDKFEEVLKLSGRKNPLFSRNSADLRSPELIEGTDIFVEVGFGAKYLTNLSNKVISYFGYGEGSLVVKAKMD